MDEKFIKYIELRLEQWAEWYSIGNSYGVGYPHRSIEHRLMTEGTIEKSATPKPLPCNEEAEEIEALVVEMEKQNKKMALILRHHYFGIGALRDKAKVFSGEHSSISYKRFKDYVDMAQQWLAGRLSGSL